jgi:homoserine kinase
MDATAITVRVPATSANLGAGFDCLGMALDMFASITVTFGGPEQPPTEDVAEKMVHSAMRAVYSAIEKEMPPGTNVKYGVGIPLGRGLGASAVARVAGVLVANEYAGHPLDDEGCLAIASEMEGHSDNACPAMFGGIQVSVHSEKGWLHVPCGYPRDLYMALLIPDYSMATKDARRVLPDGYSKEDSIHNSGRLAMFISALAAGRLDLLDEGTQDRFHQPQRATLFPPMYDLFTAAKGAGAHAAWLSGAGSTIAAICSEAEARPVAAAMLERLEAEGLTGRSMVTRISPTGATIGTVELVNPD